MAADAIKTLAQVLAGLPGNTSRLIKPQNSREIALAAFGAILDRDPTVLDDKDNSGGAGYFDAGSRWLNTDTPSIWECVNGQHHLADWRQLFPVPTPPAATVVAQGTGITVSFDGFFTYTVSITSPIDASLIPTLPKSKVSSTGQWSAAEIPNLPASKITSGVFGIGLIPNIPVSLLTGPGTISPTLLPPAVSGVDPFELVRGTGDSGVASARFWSWAGKTDYPFNYTTISFPGAGTIFAVPIADLSGVTLNKVAVQQNVGAGVKISVGLYRMTANLVGGLYPAALVQDLGEVINVGVASKIVFTAGLPLTLTPNVVYFLAFRESAADQFVQSCNANNLRAFAGVPDGALLNLQPGVCWRVDGNPYATAWPGTFPAGGFTVGNNSTNGIPLLFWY